MNALEANYRTWCAQNDVPLEDGPADDSTPMTDVENTTANDDEAEEEWDGFMDVDGDDDDLPEFFKQQQQQQAAIKTSRGAGRKRRGKVAELVREKIRSVLEDKTQLADKRARMCDEGDFLKLLYHFNLEGIHFR